MNTIKVSYDREEFWSKPTGKEIARISERIAGSPKTLDLHEIAEFVEKISLDGHTFCPATFKNGKRSKENFEQQQMFALDFDNKDPNRSVTFEEVKARAEKYNLPILFAYATFSSTKQNKFRVVFLNDTSIQHRKVAEAMQLSLGKIFPETDSSCYRDVSKMYFGGKERLYYDRRNPTTNIESIIRSLTYFLEDKNKKHLKDKLRKFSRESGIALNKKGFLDVSVIDDPTELAGATQSNHNGDFSPNAIIYSSNINGNGENSPNKKYYIKINKCTKSSVVTSVTKTDVTNKEYKNHNQYRRSDLDRMSQVCRLFREFESGSRDMEHNELFGILNNLINVDSGATKFKEILEKYPKIYDDVRRADWERHISFNKRNEYKPNLCNNFCPYRDECNHGKNILTTVHPKFGMMERIPGYIEEFASLEKAQNDVFKAISRTIRAQDNKIYVIKAQVGIGKSYSYLRIEQEHPEWRFLISGPTNLLKDELFDKAKGMGVEVRKTPSLEQIKDEIPDDVWEHIQKLYKRGQHKEVHPYIWNYLNKILLLSDVKEKLRKAKDLPPLLEYMHNRDTLKLYRGNIFTTHRYMLTMDEERLNEFDVTIIDEDPLFKSVITNHEEIPISKLKKLLKKTTDGRLVRKIKRLLKQAEDHCCIELDSFEWNDNNDLCNFDLSAFCQTERFYVRKASKEKNLKEDTVTFLKPVFFSENRKYIIVSATADETIYRQYFGEDRVEFYECKKAKNMGTLYQHPCKSMSRSSIANDPGIVRRLMNRFHMSEDRVITFMSEEIGELHFGNTEGSNMLEGENILVIGTPYHAGFIYKLAAFTMGLDFDEDEEPELQTVTYNGYRFRFTTYKNENLRAIQFWMIESELEQAVGRARLLRNSCDVHLFSNFPLSQAEMVEDFDYGKEEESLPTQPE